MIHYNMHFSPYDWDIEVYVILNNCYLADILSSLEDCSESDLQQAFLNVTTRINSGFIHTKNKRSIIVINKPETMEEFINVYNHEKNHLEMHICEEFHIDPHSEEAAELSGVLAKQLYSSLVDELLLYYTEVYNK